jgi:hypothetical protein
MSKKSEQVKSGYAELSLSERLEVKQWISAFDNSGPATQGSFSEQAERVANKSVGPRDANTCACCGR